VPSTYTNATITERRKEIQVTFCGGNVTVCKFFVEAVLQFPGLLNFALACPCCAATTRFHLILYPDATDADNITEQRI
jgi:hypothetical protein